MSGYRVRCADCDKVVYFTDGTFMCGIDSCNLFPELMDETEAMELHYCDQYEENIYHENFKREIIASE